MGLLKSKWNLLAVVLAASAFLAAFGIALAAVVQVSREVPSTLSVVEVEVIAEDNLFLSYDPDGNEPVTALEFTLINLQPPLGGGDSNLSRQKIFIRNDSDIELTLIAPCGDAQENGTEAFLGHMAVDISDLADEVDLGRTCDQNATIAPGQTVTADVRLYTESGLDPGDYSFTTVFGAIGPVPVEPPPGMVSWWPGDGNADDIVDGNDGTLEGGATFAQGKVGQGFELDGVDDFVLVADNANLNITGDVTVDLWAKRTVLGARMTLVEKGAGFIPEDVPAIYSVGFFPDDTLVVFFELTTGENILLNGPIVTDTTNFHHYAYVRDGNTHRLLLDGVVVAEDDFDEGPGDTTGLPLTIGAVMHTPAGTSDIFSEFFSGIIDEVEVFDRALSDDEIKAIFDAGSAGKIKPSP